MESLSVTFFERNGNDGIEKKISFSIFKWNAVREKRNKIFRICKTGSCVNIWQWSQWKTEDDHPIKKTMTELWFDNLNEEFASQQVENFERWLYVQFKR